MKRFKKILYLHDETSEVAAETLHLALELAKRNHGQVDLINVLEPPPAIFTPSLSASLRSRWLEESEQALNELAQSVSPDRELKTKLVEGKPHIQAIRQVLRHDYDLVIKPIGPSTFLNQLLVRLYMQLLRLCPFPVWLSNGE